jgi:hypothetical protein
MALIIHVENSTDDTDIAVRKGKDWTGFKHSTYSLTFQKLSWL